MSRLQQRLIYYRLNTRASSIKSAAADMRLLLHQLEHTNLWKPTAWECLEILMGVLDKEHASRLPEMACQRSGRCCAKQVPRVSVFELERIALAIAEMPEDDREIIKEKMRESVRAKYTMPLIGVGVPCPLLSINKNGTHGCAAHALRPVICWASGVTTPLSHDCPIWQVFKDRFPTLPLEQIQPFLDLFAYCRNVYARDFLGRPDGKQMALLGAGILMLFNEMPTDASDPVVVSIEKHEPYCSEEVWYNHKMPPPPQPQPEEEKR